MIWLLNDSIVLFVVFLVKNIVYRPWNTGFLLAIGDKTLD